MRALVQRVTRARVTVKGPGGDWSEVGAIGRGLCVFVGVTGHDTTDTAVKTAEKLGRG